MKNPPQINGIDMRRALLVCMDELIESRIELALVRALQPNNSNLIMGKNSRVVQCITNYRFISDELIKAWDEA